MRFEKLKDSLPEKLFSELEKIPEMRPCQQKAIDSGLLDGKSLLVCSPTGSGKTLVAEIAAIKNILDGKGKCVYIVPLKSLASEKFAEFKGKYETLGIKVAISIGDLDTSDPWLAEKDLIITVSEKLDSLLRHGSPWISSVATVVIDEIHLLNDPGRGPTLEILATMLKKLLANSQFIALSATIGNPKELAEWLGAKLVEDSWRPVKLYEGVFNANEIEFFNAKEKIKIKENFSDSTIQLAVDTIKNNKQALVFCATKQSAESMAEKISKANANVRQVELAKKILHALPKPTVQCRKLAKFVLRGVAFHHAGLVQKQKSLIEDSFRNGAVKIICCTPTLCLSGDTKIWCGMGEINVSDASNKCKPFVLLDGKLVPMKLQNVQRVENFSKLIKISSVSGRSIKTTQNHKLLVKRKGKKYLLPASLIKKGDRVATIAKINLAKTNNPKISDFLRENNAPRPCRFYPELAYFIGVMLGDGYSGAETINGKQVLYKGSPSVVGRDEEIFRRVEKICKGLGVSCRKTENAYKVPQLVLGKNKWFREFLVRCGVEKGERKYISDALLNMPLNSVRFLIAGLFDTDGYMQRNKNIGFSNISEKLVKQLQKLLLRYAIVSRIRARKSKVMKIYGKEYVTRPSLELIISQKKSIVDFHANVGFGIKRKQKSLSELANSIASNINYVSCKNCSYEIHKDVFSGRSKQQKYWGSTKLRIVKLLGEKGELGSRELKTISGCAPRKNESRLNHHYELISRRRIGSRNNTEWLWSLNSIGQWIYKNLLCQDKSIAKFFNIDLCPLCKNELHRAIKKGWRSADFEKDLFWDVVRAVEYARPERYAYDVILPDKPKNNHMFIADGFVVHNSAGVNLPAFRAIMKSLKRYSEKWGYSYIPVLEYKQMTGRAGRPGMEEFGEAISIAASEDESQEIYEKYICGVPEEIESKLAVEPVLRMAILGLIASGFCRTFESVINFFKETFYGFSYANDYEIKSKIIKILDKLKFYKFVEQNAEKIYATYLGKRVAELYLDPESAFTLINGLKIANAAETQAISYLHLISSVIEIPNLKFRKSDYEFLQEKLIECESYLLKKPPSEFSWQFEEFQDSFKTALLFEDWISELSDDALMEKYKIRPGELRTKLANADWILYSCQELSRILEFKDLISELIKLRVRMKHGLKEELLPLKKLKGIGRYKARKLFKNGLTSLQKIKEAKYELLASLIGPRTAVKVKGQLGEKVDVKIVKRGQQELTGF